MGRQASRNFKPMGAPANTIASDMRGSIGDVKPGGMTEIDGRIAQSADSLPLDYYQSPGARELAHKVKVGDPAAIKKMAQDMAKRLPDGATLVPVPSRSGTATVTRQLADEISNITGSPVADVIKGDARGSWYDAKKGGAGVAPDFKFKLSGEPPKNPVLIDTVKDTGATLDQARKVIPNARELVHSSVAQSADSLPGNAPNTIGKGERGAIGVKGDKPLIYTNEDLSVTPDVPQFGLDRYEAPRGKPAALKGLLGKRTANRMSEYAKAGEEGGKGWYNLDPLREQFVAELGEVEGNAQFRRYTDHLAATSPREKVKQNVKRGSLFHQMERTGEPFAHLKNPGKGDGPGTEIPKGYGSLGHETQRYLLSDLEGGGHFSSMGRPKTSSFAENLSGNQTPMTIDTHNMAALMNNKGTKRSPTPGEYKYIEDFEADIADQLGMTPAQFQASVWVGAGNDTGVADVRPFLDVFNDVVVETAEKRGITPAEALKQFIKGEKPLLGLAGMLSAGTLMEPDQPVE